MAFGPDYSTLSRTVAALRDGHNPYGLRADGQGLDLPPDLFRRLMRGEISAHEAQQEWQAREPGRREFNARLRRAAGLGYVADAAEVLGQADAPEGTAPTLRAAQTGRFASLDQAAREAASKPVSGEGIVSPQPPRDDPNAGLRAEYQRLRGQQREANP